MDRIISKVVNGKMEMATAILSLPQFFRACHWCSAATCLAC